MTRKSNNNRKRASNRRVGTEHPQVLKISLTKSHTFRFKASSATATSLTTTTLGDMLIMAATATTGYQLMNAFRLRKVEIWGPMASDLVPVTVSCDFTGSSAQAVGNSVKITDTSIGSMSAAHIVAIPPSDSTASFWQDSSSGLTLCSLEYPTNSIVDISLEWTFRDSAVPSAVVTIAGATAGCIYVRKPDTSQVLVPLSYVTI